MLPSILKVVSSYPEGVETNFEISSLSGLNILLVNLSPLLDVTTVMPSAVV